MRLSPRDILIASILGVFVVAIALVVVLVFPQNAKLKDVNSRLGQAQQDISSAQALLNQRQVAKERAALTDAESIRLANTVPENPELPSLIIELQDTATKSGLQFRQLTPSLPGPAWQAAGSVPAPSYLRVSMALQVYGTWSDTVDFLQRLRDFPRGLRVTSVNSAFEDPKNPPAGAPKPGPEIPILTDMQLEAYAIPVGAEASATPSPAPSPAPPAGASQ